MVKYMIYDYAIKNESNEQVLYIYLDYSVEFARLNSKDKNQKINSKIKDFIKRNKIDFNGKKIVLVASGLIIGTLLLNQPVKDNSYTKIDNNPISILMNKEITIDKTQDEQIENSSVQEQIQDIKEEKDRNNGKSFKKDDNKKSNSETTQSQNNNMIIEKSEKENITKNNEQEILKDNKTIIKVYRSNGNILNLELEEYLIGVVAAEMPAEFNEQALMAQAIIARTYTLKAIKNNKKLTDTSSTQNYKSNKELKEMWKNKYDIYYNKVKSAVESTAGKYLTYNNEVIEAVYHSTSNGLTEDSKNVWGNSFPYLVTVESEYDDLNPSFVKETQITYDKLTSLFDTIINSETDINILSKTSGNRVDKIEIAGKIYTGVEVRTMLMLRSADFEIIKNDVGIVFKTRGYGHGVGMSQYGANGMAKNGYNYEQILTHYYKGVIIQK